MKSVREQVDFNVITSVYNRLIYAEHVTRNFADIIAVKFNKMNSNRWFVVSPLREMVTKDQSL